MASVTQRINNIKQPRGGYIRPSTLTSLVMNDEIILNEKENIHGTLIGMAVDYLTRFEMGSKISDAFSISLKGAKAAQTFGVKPALKVADQLAKGIKNLDNLSITNACKLVTFDAWYRNPFGAMTAKGYDEINPDEPTIENIRTLVNRGKAFFEDFGPITKDGFTFDPEDASTLDYEKMIIGIGNYGGYTPTVNAGDGDFITKDTLWDFKVSKSTPTNKHTLQLLMYWIMGQHSGQKIFKSITKIGIFNPRLNTVYTLDIANIPNDIISTVESNVIGYL